MKPNTKQLLFFSILLFFFLISCKLKAQNFLYSKPVGNFLYTKFKLIGKVSNNIVAVKYDVGGYFDMKKTEVLIYDDKLQLLNKVSFKSITPKISTIDFVNEGTTFAAIIQYFENGILSYNDYKSGILNYKMISFDENGNILKTQILERVQNSNDDKYVIIQSAEKKGFALLKVTPSEINNTIAVKYLFISNDSLIHSDKIVIPFDTLTSTLNRGLLDGNNLLLSVTSSLNSDERISVYKIDLRNNASINTLRDVKNGYFEDGSVNIHSNDKHYIVTGNWMGNNTPNHSIYVWHLDKDLTDISSDSIFSTLNPIAACLQHIYYYNVSNIILKNNTADVLISADRTDNKTLNLYSLGYSGGGAYFTGSGTASAGTGFYAGRVLSMMSQKELNGNGYYAYSNVAGGPAWYNNSSPSQYYGSSGKKKVVKINFQRPTFAILNFDTQNNLKWCRCFNDSTNEDIESLLNEAVYINTASGMHLIYTKLATGNRQSLYDMCFDNNGNYTLKPIISMNIKYAYYPNLGIQLDENSLLMPCVKNGKTALARYTIK